MSDSVRCGMIQARIVLNVRFMLHHRLVHTNTARFMFHKVHFICCMTYTCEMISASAFVAFSSPYWTLLLRRFIPCIASVAASTKCLAQVATPADSRCVIAAACLVIMPRVAPLAGIVVNVTCLIITVSGVCIRLVPCHPQC